MVSVEAIKAAIMDQEKEFEELLTEGRIVEREMDIRAPPKGIATIITGIRRSGKSVLAQMLFKGKDHAYINFEDARLSIDASELQKVLEAIYSLKGKVKYIILDEIQNVKGWERFVARLVISNSIIITGSNARLMGKETATYLTGRHIDHELLPFSFREFLIYNAKEVKGSGVYLTENKAILVGQLQNYIKEGGMPQALSLGRGYLAKLFTDIIERDIAQRHDVRQIAELKMISGYLVNNFSNEITYNKVKNIAGIKTANTISKWIGYLEESYVLFTIERFSSKLKERIKAPKKVYIIDTGIINAIHPEAIGSVGRLMENIVAVELKRRVAYWGMHNELYYWKNSMHEEVNFLIRENSKTKELIQVTYASSSEDIRERETKALVKAGAEQHCNSLKVITWDYDSERIEKGKKILFVPLWKWLLGHGAV